ncbi:MAG: alpha/beta fold hydrolase [Solirubrobacterales bacterium]|nr:alpha/beta fold hydrolase [Solirubrobacterales bacterium]
MNSPTLRLPRLQILTAFAILCAMLVTVGLSASADAKQKKPAKGPAGLKFYKPPKKLAKRHGKLIWQRNAKSIVRLESARLNKIVLYTSKSPSGKRIAVSGSVHIPKGKKPKGGWPVVSYAHGTTGIADQCAPTRNRPGGPAEAYISYTDPELNAWLQAGYAVVRSDFEGLGTPGVHPYLIGKSEGRGVLDMVRAARGLKQGLISKKFLIAGHSQGGHAALFAAGLASKWTPDLKLRGTVAYAPASHMDAYLPLLPGLTTPSSLSALAALIVKGAQTASSEIESNQLLSDAALGFYPQVTKACLAELAQPDSFGSLAPSELLRPGADQTPLADVLGAQNPDVVSKAPILMAQGSADSTVPAFLTIRLKDELDASGNQLTYTEYPGVDHGSIVAAAQTEAMAFMEQRLPSSR